MYAASLARILAVPVLILSFAGPAAAQTVFVVDTALDQVDTNENDGICHACLERDPQSGACTLEACTLRAAIQQANALGGGVEITFAVDAVEWVATMALITVPLTIDGQRGTSGRAILRGDRGVFQNTGLRVDGPSGCVFRNLELTDHAVGLTIRNGDNHVLENLFVHDNVGAGISFANSGGNRIGGENIGGSLDPGNEISSNVSHGVDISGGSGGNVIQGNFIHGNTGYGLDITNAGELQLGGETETPGTGVGNVISGNQQGVELSGSDCGGNVIEGNLIGTAPGGTAAMGNASYGIRIREGCSEGTRIGGPGLESRNVISGNESIGIYAFGTGITMQNNHLGTDISGTAALPNRNGITITGSGHVIGGEGAGNLISGNDDHGVVINSSTSTPTSHITISYNRIGTDAAGTADLGNGRDGVRAAGDSIQVRENLISGNDGAGVFILGSAGFSPVSSATVTGNFVGTDAAGEAALGNGGVGISISGSPDNIVSDNVVSSNGAGISLSNASGSSVWSNFVGTNRSGTISLGNTGNGISIGGGTDVRVARPIGGDSDQPNVVGANGGHGIFLLGSTETGHIVQGNLIGTNTAGDDLGNGGSGVHVSGASRNLIGSRVAEGNTIANNQGDGVHVLGGRRNEIVGNLIFLNGGIGINLDEDGSGATTDGATPNDEGDLDTGSNDLQNFPVITSATFDPATASTLIEGRLESLPNRSFRVEVFANPSTESKPQGEVFLGAVEVMTDPDGTVTFEFSAAGEHERLTATATDEEGNTSEFSFSALVVNAVSDEEDLDPGDGSCDTGLPPVDGLPHCTLRAAIQEANAGEGADEIVFDIPGSTPYRISPSFGLPTIGESVSIDATTQPGYAGRPLVEIVGPAQMSPDADIGLGIFADEVLIRGFVVNAFPTGIYVAGSGNRIEGNYIGVQADGRTPGPNALGVVLDGGAFNVVGGSEPEDRNVISGNLTVGIHMQGGAGGDVKGNYIGLDAGGSIKVPNESHGVAILHGQNILVGGSGADEGNVISGNKGSGILIGNAEAVTILGNVIGLDGSYSCNAGEDGLCAYGNAFDGISIGDGVQLVAIGGSDPEHENLISGNGRNGIRISGTETFGINILRNLIGVDDTGRAGAHNGLHGISIDGGSNVEIGRRGFAWGNHIAANLGYGIRVAGSATAGVSIDGNRIGVEDGGVAPLPNVLGGIRVEAGAARVSIGGPDVLDSNTIYGGISLADEPTKQVTIRNNALEVPESWMEGADIRLPVRMYDAGPACHAWTGDTGPNEGIAAPRLLKLTTNVVEGIAPAAGSVEVYRVTATGTARGRYFARKVEPVGWTETDGDGLFSIPVSLEEGDLVAALFTDAAGNSSELTQLRRPVVFVPGVGGSWLEAADGTNLWLPTGLSAVAQNLSLSRMEFLPNGASVETVSADEIVERVLTIPIAYGPGLDYLEDNGYRGHPTNGQPEELDLWRFAHDWRRSPVDLVQQLSDLIEFVTSHAPDVASACEVDLVAHSYGGVVGSYYVRTSERARDEVHRFVTIGAPYLGTPQAAAAHTKGYIFGLESTRIYGDIFAQGHLVYWGLMVQMARNLPVAYSLMPGRRYWDAGGSWYLMDLYGRLLDDHNATFRFLANPKFDSRSSPLGLSRNPNTWRRELNDTHERIDDWREWAGPPQVFRTVGVIPFSTTGAWRISPFTLTRALKRAVLLENPLSRHEEGDGITHWEYRESLAPVPDAGDGTVNLISAMLGRQPGVLGGTDFSGVDSSPWIEEFTSFPCEHVVLVEPSCASPEGERSLDHVIRTLERGYTAFPEPAPKRELAPAASPEADDEIYYVSSDAPIGVHVVDQDGNHTGPVHADSLNVVEYGVPDISYWPTLMGVTVVLPRDRGFSLSVSAPDTTTAIQINRVVATGGASQTHILYPQLSLAEGGEVSWRLAAGGTAVDAALEVDADGDGTFEAAVEPATQFDSNDAAPSVPLVDPMLVQAYAYASDQEDRAETVSFLGVEEWSWEASGFGDWLSTSTETGQVPGDLDLSLASAGLPLGSYSKTLEVTLQHGDFSVSYPLVVRLDVLASPSLSAISVSPDYVVLEPGESQLFAAEGFDESGRPFAFDPEWTAGGGTIDSEGRFVAGAFNGNYIVSAASDSVRGEAIVEIVGGEPVGAEEESETPPDAFALHPNFPNPFNPETTVPYEVPVPSRVRLEVYDVLGRRITLLVDRIHEPGRYAARFDGGALPSGLYLLRFEADGFASVRTMMLVK